MSSANRSTPLHANDAQDNAFLEYFLSAYIALIPVGTLFFRFFSLESGAAMTFDRALFWTANSLTCTGFRLQPNNLTDFSTVGQIGVFLLMIAGALFALIAGGLIVARILGLTYSLKKIVTGALFLLAIGSVFGAGFLMGSSRSFFAALFEATSSIANAGMSIDGQRILTDWRLYLIITPLCAVGSLGLVVILQLFDNYARSIRPSDYTWRVLRLTAAVWLIGFFVLLVAQGTLTRESVLTSWLYAINTRSLGADVILPVPFARQMWWLLAMLILVGGMPGSTAGGLRVTALTEAARELRSDKPTGTLPIAVIWIALFLAAFALVFVLLLAWQPQLATDDAVILAAGALGNTGISHGSVDLTGRPLHLLTVAMYAGHLGPVFLAWWMKNTHRYHLPVM